MLLSCALRPNDVSRLTHPVATARSGLERVFQSQLDLAHAGGRARNHSEVLMGGRAWHSGLRRPRQNVQIRHLPVRVVKNVKSLKPELEHVALLIRHAELLVYLGVESDDSRTHNSTAPGIAELSGRSFGKGSQAPISGGSGVVEIGASLNFRAQ